MKGRLILIFCFFLLAVSGNAQIITTFAGNGTGGYSGDGGPATAAQIDLPWGIAADDSGNVYIGGNNYTAYGYCTVRKINTSGIITTIAGNGTCSFAGDGGPATAAYVKNPNGVATDASGNIYVLG